MPMKYRLIGGHGLLSVTVPASHPGFDDELTEAEFLDAVAAAETSLRLSEEAALAEKETREKERFDAVAAALDVATAEAIFGRNPHTPPGQVGR